jgi:hypothetical protein
MRSPLLIQNDVLTTPTTPFNAHDLMMACLMHLSAKDLLAFRSVSKKFNEAVSDIVRQAMQSIPRNLADMESQNTLVPQSLQSEIIKQVDTISKKLREKETAHIQHIHQTSFFGHFGEHPVPIIFVSMLLSGGGNFLLLHNNKVPDYAAMFLSILICAISSIIVNGVSLALKNCYQASEYREEEREIKALKQTMQFFSATNNDTTVVNVASEGEMREMTDAAASSLEPLLRPLLQD